LCLTPQRINHNYNPVAAPTAVGDINGAQPGYEKVLRIQSVKITGGILFLKIKPIAA
jgi:hypothetical protein